MKRLRLTYRRWGWPHTRHATIPEQWGELTARQFICVAALHLRGTDVQSVIATLCGLGKKIVNRMDEYQRFVLLEQTEWVRSTDKPHDSFIISRLPGTKLYAPGQRLRGCSLQQFMTADTFFQLFTIHPERQQYLDQFVAALYLRPGEYYNPDECQVPSLRDKAVRVDMERNTAVIAATSLDVRFAVYLNFILIRAWLSKAYPLLFPQGETSETDSKAAPKPTDWLAVFDAFVGDNVAEMRRYQMMAATDAFRVMNRRIRQNMKQK